MYIILAEEIELEGGKLDLLLKSGFRLETKGKVERFN